MCFGVDDAALMALAASSPEFASMALPAAAGGVASSTLLGNLAAGAGAASAGGLFSEMAPFANPMMKSMVPSTLGGDFTAMSASPFQSGLPWQKLAKLGGAGMLMAGQQQQPTPPAGAAPSASGPQGAPASLFTMPQIGAGAPLGGAQAMQARLQGMDPMMMLRMQQRGY